MNSANTQSNEFAIIDQIFKTKILTREYALYVENSYFGSIPLSFYYDCFYHEVFDTFDFLKLI